MKQIKNQPPNVLFTPLGPITLGSHNVKVVSKAKSSGKAFLKAMRKASDEELFALPEGYAE